MRLSEQERQAIKEVIFRFDPEAKIYLFGSRAQAGLKGGDIDLLVVSSVLDFREKISILCEIKEKLGEQKIDLLIKTPKASKEEAFITSVLKTAVLL